MKKNVEIFIIPNSIQARRGNDSELTREVLAETERRVTRSWNMWVKDFKAPSLESLSKGYVQIWGVIPGNENSNFTSHHGELEEYIGEKIIDSEDIFPELWPVEWFNGKKEGDTIEITLKNGTILSCRLNQLSYRYRSFGSFDETLQSLGVW